MINKNFEKSKKTSLEKLYEIIKKTEEKTKIKKTNLFLILAISFSLIWFGILDAYISYLLTIYFQIIWSLKVIDKKVMDGDKQWLSYWIIFSMFVILDMFSAIVIKIIPFYYIIRTFILLWLSLPGLKGASGAYDLFFVQMIKISHRLKLLDIKKKGTYNQIRNGRSHRS